MDAAAAVLNTPDTTEAVLARGGKLLMYHGWSDQQNPRPPRQLLHARRNTAGKSALGKSIQLYMVPDDHCQGGVGTDTFDKIQAMEEGWRKAPPAQIVASHATTAE